MTLRLATLPSMHPLIETQRMELIALAKRRGVTGVRVDRCASVWLDEPQRRS